MDAANLLLLAAAVVWILARQLRVEPVRPRLLVLVPLLLGYSGLRALDLRGLEHVPDAAVLTLGLVVSAAFGVWRGTTVRVWQDASGTWMRQGTRLTLALWGATAAVRVVLIGAAHALGAQAAAGTGALLVSLAVTFAAQNAVTGVRMTRPARGGVAVASA